MSQQRDVEREVRDDICGGIMRRMIAEMGDSCMQVDVQEVADRLDSLRGVSVDRAEPAERQADDRDFIDLTVTRAPSSGRMFLILQRNGFTPEAMAGNWEGGTPEGEQGRVVLQWKR